MYEVLAVNAHVKFSLKPPHKYIIESGFNRMQRAKFIKAVGIYSDT